MTLTFRSTRGTSDAADLIAVHTACTEMDVLLADSAEEYRANLDWYNHELEQSNPKDWVITEQNGEIIGYGHTLWNWSEHDGTQVYLHVGWIKPEHRNQGFGTQLIAKLETRCHEKATANNHLEHLEIAGNASGTEIAAQALLRGHDYFTVFTMLDLELDPFR